MTRDQLEQIAFAFRSIVEGNRKDLGEPLCRFPRGCCETASLLLGKFVMEECETGQRPDPLCVNAVGGSGSLKDWSHAWLVVGEIVVDVTADQFDEDPLPPVYVGEELFWHRNWETTATVSVNELWTANAGHQKYLEDVYRQILPGLREGTLRE